MDDATWINLKDGQHVLFDTYPRCINESIGDCDPTKWRTKRQDTNMEDDAGLTFECGKYSKLVVMNFYPILLVYYAVHHIL